MNNVYERVLVPASELHKQREEVKQGHCCHKHNTHNEHASNI